MFIQTSKGWTPSFFPEGHIGVLLNDSLVLGAQLFKRGIIRPVFSREKFEDVSRENINRRTTTMSVEAIANDSIILGSISNHNWETQKQSSWRGSSLTGKKLAIR